MKNQIFACLFVCAAISATSTATAVVGQEAGGSEVSLHLGHNAGIDDNFKRLALSFDHPINDATGVQVDLSAAKYEDPNSVVPAVGVHLTHKMSQRLTLGVFAAAQLRGTQDTMAGVELDYQAGGFSADGYVAAVQNSGINQSGVRGGFDLSFGLGTSSRFAALAGAHAQAMSGDDRSYGYLGAAYTTRRGTRLAVTAGQNDHSDTIITFRTSYALGPGVTFSAKDTRSVFIAY